ncbi:hypothetical protein PIB30_014509 [Stylosanthes scabra]|uniref:F-box domain-containing protein n=1 Tax=Stylosanthes scabra TaxID=79078 RepID=A0ABU6X6M2_9FABA|nr:hypothetical protein [Stylosanthes scabra]
MGEKASLKKKKNEIRGMKENKCKNISDLPIALIYEIFSNLPMKECTVRTSVLSKYWGHQWRNLYKFELKEESQQIKEIKFPNTPNARPRAIKLSRRDRKELPRHDSDRRKTE